MSGAPETFDQFYARISANRKQEILACADPVERADLEAWDRRCETQWKAAWQIEEARKESFQSSVTDEELQERRQEYLRENPAERDQFRHPDEHCTHWGRP